MLDHQGFDLWADGYDQSVQASDSEDAYPFAGYRDVLARVYSTIRAHGTGSVLDIGFGTGVLTKRLYDDGYTVSGIDFSKRMLSLAQTKMPGACLLRHDFTERLPERITTHRYDIIVSTYALHHLNDAQKVSLLKSLFALLSPGGLMVIADISFETPEALEQVRTASGDTWDDGEIYLAYSTFRPLLCVPSSYEQISFCAGMLTLHKPRMVLFDFGETLAKATRFDTLAGVHALMPYITRNPLGLTAEAINAFENEQFYGLDRVRTKDHIEVHEHTFLHFVHEYLRLEFSLPIPEREVLFMQASRTLRQTEGIAKLLEALGMQGIRTGVLSNIMYSGGALRQTLDALLPGHAFDPVIATSEYVYRKPNPLIFHLALRKAGLSADKVWYCGDSMVCDVQGATGAGIAPIWYQPGVDTAEDTQPPQNCAIVRSWHQLTAWMGCTTIEN